MRFARIRGLTCPTLLITAKVFESCSVISQITSSESAATFIEHDALIRFFVMKGDSTYEVPTKGLEFGPLISGAMKFSAKALAFWPDTLWDPVGLTEVLSSPPAISSTALGLTGILMNCLTSTDGSLFA